MMWAVDAEACPAAPVGCLAAAMVETWFVLMPDRTRHLHALLVHGWC